MWVSLNSCAYRIYNKRTKTMMESTNVVVDNKSFMKEANVVESTMDILEEDDPKLEELETHVREKTGDEVKFPRVKKEVFQENVVGAPRDGVCTRGSTGKMLESLLSHVCFPSKIEPNSVKEALGDVDWVD